MRQLRKSGSVEGVFSNEHSYSDYCLDCSHARFTVSITIFSGASIVALRNQNRGASVRTS